MEDRIAQYVEELFSSAPQTQKAYEMKLELTQNLIENYNALISEGKSPEEACNITLMGIGDLSELFYSLEEHGFDAPDTEALRRRSASLTALAVTLYIFSIVPIGVFSTLNLDIVGFVSMFTIVSIATGLLVYNNMTKPKKKVRSGDDAVSAIMNSQVKKDSKKQLMNAISAAYWPLVVALYFILSFATSAWYITWIIYLIAPAIFVIIKSMISMLNNK